MSFLSRILNAHKRVYIKSPVAGKVMFVSHSMVEIDGTLIGGLTGTDIELGDVVKKHQVIGYRSR